MVDLPRRRLRDEAGAGARPRLPAAVALELLRGEHAARVHALAGWAGVVPVGAVDAEALELIHKVARDNVPEAEVQALGQPAHLARVVRTKTLIVVELGCDVLEQRHRPRQVVEAGLEVVVDDVGLGAEHRRDLQPALLRRQVEVEPEARRGRRLRSPLQRALAERRVREPARRLAVHAGLLPVRLRRRDQRHRAEQQRDRQLDPRRS